MSDQSASHEFNVKETNIAPRFGAVLEEFEVQDALHNVFATKYGGFTFE